MSKTTSASQTPVSALPADLAAAAAAAYGKKATDVVALDMRKIPSFTDFFLICSSQNQRQMRAVADAIEMALKERGVRPAHVEGDERSEWILLDYFDFVIHVFTTEQRRFYALERLWASAGRMDVRDQPA